jgi:hypothetical protein
MVCPLTYPHTGYGFYTHTVRSTQSVALIHSQHSCRASCEGLSDIPQHFGTVGELKLMQMAYRSLSSHVRVATDIKRVLPTSYAHLLSPEDSNLSTKRIQGGGTGSTHVAHAIFTVVGGVKP